MKLISLGNLNKKFLLYFLAFIIIVIAYNLVAVLYLNKNIADNQISIPLNIIIRYSFYIIFIIPEILTNKKHLKEKNEIQKNEIIDNNIVYIYKHPSKNRKSLIILSLVFLFFIIYLIIDFFRIIFKKQYKL